MKDETRLVHAGRDPQRDGGIVNPPVSRASTVLYPTLQAFAGRSDGDAKYRGVRYGAYGTANALALADAVAELEGGAGAVVTSTGLSAVTLALTALLGQGDHVLMTDSAYGPTRAFCNEVLARFGVETTYYDPLIGAGIAGLMRPNTRVVFTESPGSLTFEVQDVPAIADAAHRHGTLVLLDNTWSAGLFFKPFDHGVDVSIQAATKYIAGHSDAVIGIITARSEALFRRIKDTTMTFGDVAAPDTAYLALRGLRSMAARLRQQEAAGLQIAAWLRDRTEVKRVLYPALPDDPGHTIWKRDFTGACSLFSIVLHTHDEGAVAGMVDRYRYFKIGASWGGFESLVIPAYPAQLRTAVPWTEPGFVLRYHVGLEATEDLIGDLEEGFERLRQVVLQKR